MLKNKPPTVLIYTKEYPPFKGGAGRYCASLASAFASKGINVHVLAPDYQAGSERENGSGLIRVARFTPSSPIRNAWRLLWTAVVLKADHVIVGDAGALFDFGEVPRPRLLPYSVVTHGTEVLNIFHRMQSEVESFRSARFRRFFDNATLLIHSNQAVFELLRESGCNTARALLVYPAVDLEASARQPPEFADRLKQRYGLSNESILLCVARLDTDKGQDILLKALPLVLAEHPDAKLILVGEGPMYEELERLAVALKIEDSVIFTGEVPSDELAAFYTLCSFFVMPSRSVKRVEGFGIVYLEAALFQRTSVAGNQGGVPEAVIDGLTGLLVDPMSTEEVATGIIRLLDEPEFRETLAARAQDRVLSEFQIDHMAERLLREGSVFGQAGVGVGRRNVGLAIWAFQLAVVSYKGMIRDLLRKVWRFVIRKVGGS